MTEFCECWCMLCYGIRNEIKLKFYLCSDLWLRTSLSSTWYIEVIYLVLSYISSQYFPKNRGNIFPIRVITKNWFTQCIFHGAHHVSCTILKQHGILSIPVNLSLILFIRRPTHWFTHPDTYYSLPLGCFSHPFISLVATYLQLLGYTHLSLWSLPEIRLFPAMYRKSPFIYLLWFKAFITIFAKRLGAPRGKGSCLSFLPWDHRPNIM